MSITIRDWKNEDDVAALTRMLHRAYAPLAAAGLRYMATHQSPDVTMRRLTRGRAFVAEKDGEIIGTLTVYPPDPESTVAIYRDPMTYHFGQFAVDPGHNGNGIGRTLHQAAIDHTREQGGRYLSLDTAGPAADLIATYQRWGYRIMERMSFSSTNYESVIMTLDLRMERQ
jgi:GNAT superfamily N-acetyltransferase